jgi:hypothetical protein
MDSGRLRLSTKNASDDSCSVLVSGMMEDPGDIVGRLRELGLEARRMGSIVIASGKVTWQRDGACKEFAVDCHHQTAGDAARHAINRLRQLVVNYGIYADVEEILPDESGTLIPREIPWTREAIQKWAPLLFGGARAGD